MAERNRFFLATLSLRVNARLLLPDLCRRCACNSFLSRRLRGLGVVLAELFVRKRESGEDFSGVECSVLVGVVGVVEAGEDVEVWLPVVDLVPAEWSCKQNSGNSSLHWTLPGRLEPDSGRCP